MAFDELSPMAWLGIGFIALVITGLVMLFVVNLQDRMNTELQGVDSIPQNIKDLHADKTAETQSILDYAFLAAFAILAISVILVARSTLISPFWTIILFIVLVMITVGAAFMSNFAYEVDTAGNLGFETYMPITHHIIDNAVAYIIAIGLAALIFSRGGPGSDF